MRLLPFCTIVVFSFFLKAQDYPEKIYTESGLAINGYDPVAYFTESKAVKGAKQFSNDWNGSTWLFASGDNLKAFKENPEKYAPQYGGYCAFGMSSGYKAKIDPNAWTIHDGKLYLNYNSGVQKKWLTEKEAYIQKATANWKAKFQ
ncbi:MAG: YHS domain-containing (seleno)protein [Cyclobacteriaceae bacterium]